MGVSSSSYRVCTPQGLYAIGFVRHRVCTLQGLYFSDFSKVRPKVNSLRKLCNLRLVTFYTANMTAKPSKAVPHAWSSATDTKVGGLTNISEGSSIGGDMGAMPMLSVEEAERLVEEYQATKPDQIGSSQFLKFHVDLERLNLQAHQSAQTKNDEFILEALLTFDQLPNIIKDLVAIEVWRENVLPLLVRDLAGNNNVMRVYFTLYHEATLVNLLEVLMYHNHVVGALGETAVDLVDYVARRMQSLAVPVQHNEMVAYAKKTHTAAETADHITNRDKQQEIKDHINDIGFKVGVASVSIARYLCEHIGSLSLSAQQRILDTHDFLVMITPLVEEPPWTRRTADGAWEKLGDNNAWTKVEKGDLLKITKCEAQVWLLIYHLTCDGECRKAYGLNAFRKEQLLRLRKYLNDVVLDQVPVLADVMRYMDELQLMSVPENSTGQGGQGLMMQAVAGVRDDFVRGVDWKEVAKKQFAEIWSKVTDAKDVDVRKIGGIYDMEGIEDVMGESRPFEMNSLPISSVVIHAGKGDNMTKSEFKIKAKDTGTVVETADDGKYTRFKLVHVSTEGDSLETALDTDSPVTVTATFDSSGLSVPHIVNLVLEDGEFEQGDKIPAKCWKQVGGTKEKLVAQIGFERVVGANGYKLGRNVFISQPVYVDLASLGL